MVKLDLLISYWVNSQAQRLDFYWTKKNKKIKTVQPKWRVALLTIFTIVEKMVFYCQRPRAPWMGITFSSCGPHFLLETRSKQENLDFSWRSLLISPHPHSQCVIFLREIQGNKSVMRRELMEEIVGQLWSCICLGHGKQALRLLLFKSSMKKLKVEPFIFWLKW